MGTTQKLKSTKDEQSSSKKSYQILEGKYKTLEQSLYTEKNERLAAVTRTEVVELGLSHVGNELVINPSKMGPSTKVQGVGEVTKKVVEAVKAEKVAEDIEKN
ncbi:hypothetical protein FNV43_RR02407 [Rhamnella rubrinervis]|uniref:Uncharacterized protein n=1 Tax=Rhamnella rubrinervis TaxID=2594499 RepID=A0A8K0MTR3_9ROSA|nr:hypothetical protein FNV43_RR02407 [Rhamnella rubrinervis]